MRTMAQPGVNLERTQPRLRSRGETVMLAAGGYALCVTGFVALAAGGGAYPAATSLLILGGALLASLPLLLLTFAVAATETWTGRAWASGFRRLLLAERTRAETVSRALRYAGFLWLANGLTLWVASVL